jgi:pimeloyl-ACP methyl ester carboxylesterase
MKLFPTKTSVAHTLAVVLFALLHTHVANAQQDAGAPSVKPESNQSAPASPSLLGHRIEDLDSLSLEGSDLNPEKPFVGEKDDLPEFTRELVQVHWRDADPIDLYVIRPRGVEKPPVVLYLYSYPSEGDQFKDDGYCRRVTRGGFAAVGFVSALTGQRYHSRPMKQWFVSELQEALVASVHDVQMILNYLATRGDLNLDRVGMMGAGSGATIAILAATVEPRIKALDLLDPWGDWPDWMAYSARIPDAERANYLKPEFLKRVAPFDPVQWLPQLKSVPVRLEFLMDDIDTPASCKKRIESAASHDSVQIVKFDTTRALLDASSGGKHFQWIKDQLDHSADRAEAK